MTAPSGAAVPGHDFELDDFQRRAIAAIEEGRSVLVAAPTGSGKTVVAEHAIADALRTGGKAFYTTPIKALSNQKYADLVRVHGPDRVGLLTGDNSVNGDAPVVVMTTEVLRNMIYAASPTLRGLRYVVLDEVHYLQDAYRGPVWEEVIIHLQPSVRLVCLSATVSNAEELTDWIETVRGPTAAVVEERRPVELRNLFMVADRSSDRLQLLPTLVDGRPNPEGLKLDAVAQRGQRGRSGGPHHRGSSRRLATPARTAVIERLDDERMLPSIFFIFSRKACDDAVRQCLDAGLRLTDGEERARILAICDERVANLRRADLDVLGYRTWRAGMASGIAAHHAGMVPPFKEAVEACFTAGLVKVVFATETLALGINMPARSVVIERFSKFNGERNETLTPGQYTQLTGRAGRRGIDPVGDAVVLWSPFTTFEEIAGRAASRSFAISSSFRPTYNMAANLVRRYEPDEAHHLLNLSFAQYQADGEVVRIEARLERATARVEAARDELRCDRGDVVELFELERRLEASRGGQPDRRLALEQALSDLRPGDVIQAPGGRNGGAAVVMATTNRRSGLGIRALTAQRRRLHLTADDFERPPQRLGRIDLPEPYAPNTTRFQRETAHALARARLSSGKRVPRAGDDRAPELDDVWAAIEAHPSATCPDLGRHRRAAAQLARHERERSSLERQVRGRDATLARHFDRVLELLGERGYLDGWALTEAGGRLARIYHEADLLIAECLERGVLDGLDPPTLAGLASCFVHEHRGTAEPPTPWFPSSDARSRWRTMERLHVELNGDEARRGLALTRAPDPGFVALAHAWAAGEGLDDLLADGDVSGGDFVRTTKQLLDLLRQLAEVATAPATRTAALAAADGLFRGVVSASSAGPVVEDADEPGEGGGELADR